jgi:hypothetical protein
VPIPGQERPGFPLAQAVASEVPEPPPHRGETESAMFEKLLARAVAQGAIRVIVELRVQQGDLRGAQDAVLKALAGTAHRVTRRYTAVPFLAMEVGPEALRLLAASPVVLRVQEDQLHAPQERTP